MSKHHYYSSAENDRIDLAHIRKWPANEFMSRIDRNTKFIWKRFCFERRSLQAMNSLSFKLLNIILSRSCNRFDHSQPDTQRRLLVLEKKRTEYMGFLHQGGGCLSIILIHNIHCQFRLKCNADLR